MAWPTSVRSRSPPSASSESWLDSSRHGPRTWPRCKGKFILGKLAKKLQRFGIEGSKTHRLPVDFSASTQSSEMDDIPMGKGYATTPYLAIRPRITALVPSTSFWSSAWCDSQLSKQRHQGSLLSVVAGWIHLGCLLGDIMTPCSLHLATSHM